MQITNESAREKAKQIGLTTLDPHSNKQNLSKINNKNNLGLTLNGSTDSQMEIGSRIESMNDSIEHRDAHLHNKNKKNMSQHISGTHKYIKRMESKG